MPHTKHIDPETACCIWEAMIDLRSRAQAATGTEDDLPGGLEPLAHEFNAKGTAAMRLHAIALSGLCDEVWDHIGGPNNGKFNLFDWDFVPAFVLAVFQTGETSPQKIASYLQA